MDLRPTYWRTAQSVQRNSWADFLDLWTSRVGRSFVGETEEHLFAPNAVRRRICTLQQCVGEIGPWSQFHYHFMSRFCTSRFLLNLLAYGT